MKFEELSKADQKVRIVKDAIRQIKLGKIKPTQGIYLKVKNNGSGKKIVSDNDNLQTLIKKPSFKCEACAKGALFAACVLGVNEVYGKDEYSSDLFQSRKLRPWFSKKEIDLIETTFEGWLGPNTLTTQFATKYKNSEKRLLAILKNILKNKTFKP